MSAATVTPAPAKRQFRYMHALVITLAVVVFCAAAYMFGWDLRGWFKSLWDTLTSISLAYLVPALLLQTLQTVFAASAWFAILRYAYPESNVLRRQVLACYAVSVALNGFLPANLGTLVCLLMFTAVIAAATFTGVFAGYLVQKIFFTVIGAFVYLYLFLSVSGSFSIKFGFSSAHPWAAAVVLVGGAVLVVLLCRLAWKWIKKLWEQAKVGGKILGEPRAYFGRVFFPEFLSWVCKLGVIGLFLAAYKIPVTFNTIMHVVGGNSIANVVSVTPGGAGVNQAFNVATLSGVTDPTTATAYSIGQQLITTAWNQIVAIVMLVWAFGWTGGKQLVTESYQGAKDKAAEQSEARKEKRAEKKAARAAAKEAE